MSALRIVFFGTAELACPSLAALAQSPEFEVAAVVTQPDRPKGRHLIPQPSAVKTLAMEKGLPVFQPDRARSGPFIDQLSALRPDLILVVAYGQILPRQILELPRFGCVNVHASLLPKYRGAAPIQWAVLNDERETGVTIMKMDEGLDTGDILSQQATPIGADDNAQTLHVRLAKTGADLLLATVRDYVAGRITRRKQPEEGASYARKITRDDGRLDWSLSARSLWNRVRALVPWPGAWTCLAAEPKPQLLKIWRAELADGSSSSPGEILAVGQEGIQVACGEGALRLLVVQLEGGRKLKVGEFLAGHRLERGRRLS